MSAGVHRASWLAPLLLALAFQDTLPSPEPAEGVRLIVLVSIDQLTHEALDPLGPHLEGGIGRCLAEGAIFPDAEVAHGRTETAPGHASLGTGCLPAHHGVIANEWLLRSGKREYCFADESQRPLRQDGPGEGAGRSAVNLRRPALAELLRAVDPASRSVAVTGKDRAAIGMAGSADWCLWWDQEHGGFQSSTAWGLALPEWVRAWNAGWLERLGAGPFGSGWLGERVAALEDAALDDRAGEGGRVFPFARPALPTGSPAGSDLQRQALFAWTTPACDAFTVELAMTAVEAEELGADEHVDLLVVGLSGCDIVGHPTGPGSREVADLLLCADAALGQLFARLDARVGAGGWIAAVSSDHGVMPLPEVLVERGLAARRVSRDESMEAYEPTRAALLERHGESISALGLTWRDVVLVPRAAPPPEAELAATRALVADLFEERGASWVLRAFPWERLRAVAREGAEADELLRLEAASFDEERSPDVSVVPRPGLLFDQSTGTSHGTPHDYDRLVPLFFLGPGFDPGLRRGPARTIDVLPTLFARAGLPLPAGLDGTALD